MKKVALLKVLSISVALIALALSGWGCGDSYSSDSAGANAATASGSAQVSMKNLRFSPSDLTVTKGTTVNWNNDDSTPHTVTADDGLFDSGNMDRGRAFSFTFDQTGTFEYSCTIHPNMTGKVTVK
jgi:plastocyanin